MLSSAPVWLLLLAGAGRVSITMRPAAEAAPQGPGATGRQLLIANTTGLVGAVTTFGTVAKSAANPLLKIGAQLKPDKDPRRPWASGSIYSAIIADQTGQRRGKAWRAYFTSGLNWTMDPGCPPGSTCETGAAGLVYAESDDGLAWEQPNVGMMWPPNASEQTPSNILRLVEAGSAVFEDTNPAVRAGKSPADWSIKVVGQLDPLEAQSDNVMHNGGSGNYLTSTDGVHFDNDGRVGHVDVDGGRTPGARWDTETNFFFDPTTQKYVGVMRAPRDPHCGIWWPACLRHCKSCGAGNLTDQRNGLVSVRAVSIMQSANASFDSRFTDNVVSVYPSPAEQLYSQVTFPLHGLYFGIVSKADVYEKAFPVGTFNGKPAFGHVNRVHCGLQWSRDLLHWEPVEDYAEFIPLAWQQWDSHLCYASARPVVMADGTVRVYYAGSSGPHDGVNKTTRLGLATLPASDRFVGYRQNATTVVATVHVEVLCAGATLLVGADLDGTATLRVGAPGLAGLEPANAVALHAADTDGPDVTARFSSGADFAAFVNKTVALQVELSGGARAYSIAWV